MQRTIVFLRGINLGKRRRKLVAFACPSI